MITSDVLVGFLAAFTYIPWMAGEVVYNGHDARVAPDFIFGSEDESFQPLMDTSDLSPCNYLREWTVADPARLLKLVLLIRSVHFISMSGSILVRAMKISRYPLFVSVSRIWAQDVHILHSDPFSASLRIARSPLQVFQLLGIRCTIYLLPNVL